MAQIAITQIHDGPRNAVFHVAIEGDGSGELTDAVLVDPTTFDPPLPASPSLVVERLQYDLSGFRAKLEFDYLASDTFLWAMSEGTYADADFCAFGGLKDRSATDGDGKILLTTTGLGAGDIGVIVLSVRK